MEYGKDAFDGISVNITEEPDLAAFISDIKSGTHKFDDYPKENLEYFARRIYELRKHNTNNAT